MDIFSNPVQYAWIVAALPLAAMIVNFFGFRMLDVLTRPKEAVAQTDPHAAHDDTHSAAPETVDTHAEEAHGAHDDEHGASTGFWASVVGWIAFGAMLLAFLYACLIGAQFLGWLGYPSGEQALHELQSKGVTLHIYDWFNFGKLAYTIDFHIDALTVVMLVVVTAVSMLVHLYSMGYMAGDRGYSRFFIELSLFTVLDAAARPRRELPRPLHRLGAGRPLVLPADRLLLQPATAARWLRGSLAATRAAQSLRHDTPGRLRLPHRHPAALGHDRHLQLHRPQLQHQDQRDGT